MATISSIRAALKAALETVPNITTVATGRPSGNTIPKKKLPFLLLDFDLLQSAPFTKPRTGVEGRKFERTATYRIELTIAKPTASDVSSALDAHVAAIETAIAATNDLGSTVLDLYLSTVDYELDADTATDFATAILTVEVLFIHTLAL